MYSTVLKCIRSVVNYVQDWAKFYRSVLNYVQYCAKFYTVCGKVCAVQC
jgi:hypothetical protein